VTQLAVTACVFYGVVSLLVEFVDGLSGFRDQRFDVL
jgi:hypothetical protein